MGFDVSDIFGSKARLERDDLFNKLALIKPLIARQESLVAANAYLEEVVSRVNRHKDDMLEFELLQMLDHDRSSGSLQINLDAKPLILVIDLGLNSTAIALAQCRLDSAGSIMVQILTTKIVAFGASIFEAKLTEWVKDKFIESSPSLEIITKDNIHDVHFQPIAKRLLSLLCQNSPQGEMEESITIDSKTYRATINLFRSDLSPLFMTLIGSEGELIKEIRVVIQNAGIRSDALDRVVCLGMYGRLPLVRDGLEEVFKRPVVFKEALLLDIPVITPLNTKNTNNSTKASVSTIGSDTQGYRHQEAVKPVVKATSIPNNINHKILATPTYCSAKNIKEAAIRITCPVTRMELILVKGGTFQMGDTIGDGDCDEKPAHEVYLDAFYIGKYPVTQREWKMIMGNNPSYFKSDRNPVENINWNDCQEFIKILNQKTGKQYRLPTEAEWEYAARSGGKNEKYAGGNNVDAVAWYDSNCGGKTHPVGHKPSNGLCLFDMSGNVSEWCQDWYNSGYYKSSPKSNPQGPSSGSRKVIRGGSCDQSARSTRVTSRPYFRPESRHNLYGMRLVLPQD